MKKLVVSTSLLALIALGNVQADQAKDEDAIRKRHGEFMANWNKHDAKAMAAMWAEDGDLINPGGIHAKGPAEIEKFFTEEHSAVMKGTTYSGTITDIRFAAPNVAVVDVDAVVTGMKAPDGTDAPPLKHHVTWVAVKKNRKWMALAARPAVPVSMGGTMAK